MDRVKTILILGKLPPPYMGPAVATKLMLESQLALSFRLVHVNTNTHSTLATLGNMRTRGVICNLRIYCKYVLSLYRHKPAVVLVPISQTTIGLLKDGLFVFIGALFRRRVAVILRGSEILEWYQGASPTMKWYYRTVMKRLRAAFVLSDRLHYLFEPFLEGHRILTVTNGNDYPSYKRKVSNDNVVIITYLSNLQPSKGIQDVINSLGMIRCRGVKYELHVAGLWRDAGTRSYCQRVVRDHDLPVRFYGGITDHTQKSHFLSESDMFIFVPRRPEGQPWAIIEALAAGLPIIATDQGAICDMVHDGENGFIVPPNSPQHVSEKIMLLMEDPDLRRRMGVRSREIYKQGYTKNHMVQSFHRAFINVLKK